MPAIPIPSRTLPSSTLTRLIGVSADAAIHAVSGLRLDSVSGSKASTLPAFSDQVLPFDLSPADTNEQRAATTMTIFEVGILNEGSRRVAEPTSTANH